jgi:SAM-dependent methyltransferase
MQVQRNKIQNSCLPDRQARFKIQTFHNPEDFQRFREVLKSAKYTPEEILKTIGVKDIHSISETDVPLLLHRTNNGTPLDTLIRLFLIEVPCNIKAVQQAIQPIKLETLAETGLIKIDGNSVTAAVKLLPYNDLFVVFDLPCMLETDLKRHYVMGIGSSTLTLANLTIRKKSSLTLDLGTGCGIHAFLAARHSDHVVAVDLNPRAVQLTEFNAKLNGLSNVECLEGNLFEPVKGKRFDLVITNPPFVISPENRYIYRDGGMEADQITQKIVRQVPLFLTEGGYCQILCNWTESSNQDWRDHLHKWFKETGCDVWVLRSETRDIATYASTWIRHTEKDNAEQFTKRFNKWMAYYEKQGIDAISAGLITMRRSSSNTNWFRADDAPEKMIGPCGDHIVQRFEIQDFLEACKDESTLLNTRLQVSPDVRLERQSKPSPEGWMDETVKIHLIRGLAYSGNIDHFMANVIVKCDGQREVGILLNEIANSLGVDRTKIMPKFCDIVRNLIEKGFLLPLNSIN